MDFVKYLFIGNPTTQEKREYVHGIKEQLEAQLNDLRITIVSDVQEGLKLYKARDDWALLLIIIEPSVLMQIGRFLTILRQTHPTMIVAVALGIKPADQARVYEYGVNICFNQQTVFNIDIARAFLTNFYLRFKAITACIKRQVDELELLAALQDVSSGMRLCFHGNLEIDHNKRLVTLGGNVVDLTAKEYDLLYYLASHAGRVVTRNEIMENVFDSEQEYASDLNSRISRLRKKIERDPKNPTYIYTKREVGYMFMSD